MKSQVIIGMAGHIDHGKTSIVKLLTGHNTDILKQEQERGMTIDIGFAHFNENITIIDVPGHEKFIKNMVTGISYIDVAILVIAADDGVMPQTIEHFEILKILNVKKGIIILNKIDLVDEEWIDLVESEIEELVRGSFLENQSIFRVSSVNKTGFEEVKSQVLASSVSNDEDLKNNRGLFRMYIDRSFSQQGFGTVVTGTVISGEIKVGSSLCALPANKKVRLRSAQSHHNNIDQIKIGYRAALNLNGIDKKDIERGSHLSNLNVFDSISTFLAKVTLLDNEGSSLSQNQRLRFHIGTSEVIGRISICNNNILNKSESGICLIKLEDPIVLSFQDKFLIRTYSPMKTIGGGLVEDINCFGKWSQVKEFANQLANKTNIAEKMNFIIQNQLGYPFTVDKIQSRFGMSFDKIVEYLDSNKEYSILEYLSEKWIVTNRQLDIFLNRIVDEIKKFHSKNPYRSGVLKKELNQKVESDEVFFDFSIKLLIDKNEIIRDKEIIKLENFKINLSSSELDAQDKVIEILDSQGFSSQNYIQIASTLNISSDKLKLLINIAEQDRKIIRINEDLLFTYKNFINLVDDVKKYFSKNDKLSVADFKDIAKTSRKYAVPLLEFLDKKNITFREDNYRRLV
tara:strand:- start:1329 stop:3212 length:1884 start_codon:yes stop_codon:yes gene_type:complete